jgi:hypothetical protein
MIAAILVLLIGAASAFAYGLRRKWIDAALVVTAAAALGGVLGNFNLSAGADSGVMHVSGDGLRSSQWHDLPARTLDWRPPSGDVLRLDFPRSIQLGRMFRLTASMPQSAARRLQLFAENGQLLAETSGTGANLSAQWMPPVTEALVLKARLLDSAGKVIAEGPVPLQVHDAVPLQVQGRFGAPSFDARALNQLLAQSNAVLDWQVTLGKTVTRSEAARAPIERPDFLITDAAYLERLGEPARARLLAQVANGTPLIILGASASEPATWSRMLKLDLREQANAKASGAPLALMNAPFVPAANNRGGWAVTGDRVWTRPWEKGRIAWIGVGEWHRYAISEPRALGLWWQDVLDSAGVKRLRDVAILDPEDMPVPGQRLELCAQGAAGEVAFPALKQTVTWQRRPDKADATCVAVWPTAPGWLKFEWGGAKPRSEQIYVFAKDDWPLWQKALQRDATLRYAARTPAAPAKSATPLPAWPFALLFMASMLGLWWRERR